LDEADLRYIRTALRAEVEPIRHAAILPPADFVDDFASHLPSGIPFEYILNRLSEVSVLHSRYKLCDIKDQRMIARTLEPVKGLSIVSRYILAASPADTKTQTMQRVLRAYGRCVAEMKMITVADIEEVPLEVLERPLTNDRDYLIELELLHKALVLYLWLSYRFVNVFKDREMAMYAKSMCEEKINRCLLEFSANPALRARLQKMKETGPAKAEAANADGAGAIEGPTSSANFGTEEDPLDPPFATGENIDKRDASPNRRVARPPTSAEDSVDQPAIPIAWENGVPLAEGVSQQDHDGPRYASAQG